MSRWYVVCGTCGVKIELPNTITIRAHALWHLDYHLTAYRGHEAKLSAAPKPKRKRQVEEEENGGGQ